MKTLLAFLTLLLFADIGNAQKIIATSGTVSNVSGTNDSFTQTSINGVTLSGSGTLNSGTGGTVSYLTLGTGSTQAQRALVTGTNGGMQTDIYLACTTGSNGLLGIGTQWAPYAVGTPDLFAQAEVSLPSYCAIHLIYSGSYQKFPDQFLFSPDISDGTQEIPIDYYNLYVRPGQKWYGNGSTIKMIQPKTSALNTSWKAQWKYRTMFGGPIALPIYSGSTILFYRAVDMDGAEFHDMTLDVNGAGQSWTTTGFVNNGIALAGNNTLIDNIHVINQVNTTNDGTESAALASGAQGSQWFVGINARNNRITNCTIDQPGSADALSLANRGSLEGIYLYGNTASLSATTGLLTDSAVANNYVNLSGAGGIQGISIGGGVDLVARNNTVVVSGSNASGFYQDTWDTTRAQFVGNHIAISGDQSIGFHFGDGVYTWKDYSVQGNTIRMSGTSLMFGITANSSSGPQYIQSPVITRNRIMLDGTNTNTLGIVVMSCTNAIVTDNEITSGLGHSIVTNSSTGDPFKLVAGNYSETGVPHLPWYSSVPGASSYSRISGPTWGIPEMELPASTGTSINLLGSGTGGTAAQSITLLSGSNITFSSSGSTFTINATTASVGMAAGTGISISGTTISIDQSVSPTWTGSHTFSNSVLLNGTNNTATNQIGVTPGNSTVPNMDQVVSAVGIAHRMLQVGSNWAVSALGGGATDATNGGVVTSTGTSSGMLYYCPRGLASGAGVIDKRIAFSKPVSVSATFIGNGITASPNTVFRFSFGKNNSGPPALGAPTSRCIGFKLVFDTTDTGHFYGEVHNGTSLTVSGTSKASIDLSNSQINHQVLIRSNAGTVKFYVDGTLVETLTGGPSTDTALAGTGTFTLEESNTGDATTAGYIYTSWVSAFLGI